MEQQEKLLKDYSVQEKSAYLNAIAAIATADHTAGSEEQEFLQVLAQSAELPDEQTQNLLSTASQASTDQQLKESLDILKNSELRFSLLTDLIAFAEADRDYSAAEKQQIQQVATYLNIDSEQFSTINQFVSKTAETEIPENATAQPNNFLKGLGMENQFSNAGMNFGSITKGLLGMLGPMVLGRMLGGRTGGGIGGLLGGLLGGGGGGLLGGGSRSSGGGLGSVISMLNGGRGMSGLGGMLGRMFGR